MPYEDQDCLLSVQQLFKTNYYTILADVNYCINIRDDDGLEIGASGVVKAVHLTLHHCFNKV